MSTHTTDGWIRRLIPFGPWFVYRGWCGQQPHTQRKILFTGLAWRDLVVGRLVFGNEVVNSECRSCSQTKSDLCFTELTLTSVQLALDELCARLRGALDQDAKRHSVDGSIHVHADEFLRGRVEEALANAGS